MDRDTTAGPGAFGDPKSIDDMAGMYLATVKSLLGSLKAYEDDKDAFGADIMYVLAQAQTRWLTSALRYWMQVASIVGAHGPDAVAAMKPGADGPSDEAKRLILLDKTRAMLREVSDMSLSEAKLLQRDLMQVEEELRAVLDPSALKTDDARRYAKSKT